MGAGRAGRVWEVAGRGSTRTARSCVGVAPRAKDGRASPTPSPESGTGEAGRGPAAVRGGARLRAPLESWGRRVQGALVPAGEWKGARAPSAQTRSGTRGGRHRSALGLTPLDSSLPTQGPYAEGRCAGLRALTAQGAGRRDAAGRGAEEGWGGLLGAGRRRRGEGPFGSGRGRPHTGTRRIWRMLERHTAVPLAPNPRPAVPVPPPSGRAGPESQSRQSEASPQKVAGQCPCVESDAALES